MADVRILVTVDSAGAVHATRQFEGAIEDLQHQAPRTETALGSLWKQVAGGAIVAQVAMKAARAFTDELKSTVRAAMEQEKADRSLAAALEITGRGVDRNLERMKRFAAEQQKVTVYGDEQIQMVQALLVQMTSLDRDGLDRATKGAMGLATTMGMDLQSAAMLVQKAIEGNVGALSRYGIRIDENLPPQEKTAALLEKLNTLYGRATAEVETHEGKLKQAKNAWSNLKEEMGKFWTQSKLVNNMLEAITKSLQNMTAEAEKIPEKQTFWEKLAGAIGVNYTGAVLGAAAATKKWGDESFVLEEYWRRMSNAVLNGRRAAIDPLPVVIRASSQALAQFSGRIQEVTADMRYFRMFGTDIAAPINDSFGSLGDAVGGTLGNLINAKDNVSDIADGLSYATQRAREFEAAIGGAASKTQTAWQNAAQAIWMMDATFSQMETNRTIAIDNEYRARLNAINATMQDEEQRQQAIMALEAEYQIKRTEARRAGAKEQKAVSLMEAVIHTARAVTEALPNIPLSIIVAALGAAQIAAIAAQPIPLAEGATFERPTLIKDVLIGEKGKEHVLQERKLIDIVKQANADARDGGGGVFTISGGINIYTPALASGDVRRVGDEIWSEMEYQATRRGYSLRGRG